MTDPSLRFKFSGSNSLYPAAAQFRPSPTENRAMAARIVADSSPEEIRTSSGDEAFPPS
jgi:hypothetical protein